MGCDEIIHHFPAEFKPKRMESNDEAACRIRDCQCETVLNHTGLYEHRHGKMLMHFKEA